MDIMRAIILGIVQGLTEFVPISSSAHLVLVPWAFGWDRAGLFFDTMLHWGTLLAVLTYFWRDWIGIARGFWRSLRVRGPWRSAAGGRLADPDSRLAWGIILGTVPATLLGLIFNDFFESLFETPTAVAGFLLVTAAFLTASERLGRRTRGLPSLNIPDALAIGLAQAIAIAPGISRSGATIAAGLARGLTREAAARFSFLLATPAILGAGLLQLLEVLLAGADAMWWPAVLAGFLAACISAYLCIKFLLAYLRRGRLYIFAVYCAVVGSAVLLINLL